MPRLAVIADSPAHSLSSARSSCAVAAAPFGGRLGQHDPELVTAGARAARRDPEMAVQLADQSATAEQAGERIVVRVVAQARLDATQLGDVLADAGEPCARPMIDCRGGVARQSDRISPSPRTIRCSTLNGSPRLAASRYMRSILSRSLGWT